MGRLKLWQHDRLPLPPPGSYSVFFPFTPFRYVLCLQASRRLHSFSLSFYSGMSQRKRGRLSKTYLLVYCHLNRRCCCFLPQEDCVTWAIFRLCNFADLRTTYFSFASCYCCSCSLPLQWVWLLSSFMPSKSTSPSPHYLHSSSETVQIVGWNFAKISWEIIFPYHVLQWWYVCMYLSLLPSCFVAGLLVLVNPWSHWSCVVSTSRSCKKKQAI